MHLSWMARDHWEGGEGEEVVLASVTPLEVGNEIPQHLLAHSHGITTDHDPSRRIKSCDASVCQCCNQYFM